MRWIGTAPLGGGRTRLRALAVLASLLVVAALPAAAGAAAGVQVTINGVAGPFFTTDQIDGGADASPNRMAWWPALSANQPQTRSLPGMSAAELVRRSGVAPEKLADGVAVHVHKPASEGSDMSDSTLTRDQVVNGIPNPLDASELPGFAVFGWFSEISQPRFERPMLNATDPSDEIYGSDGGTLTVDIAVAGDVLPVTVTADGASAKVGDQVQFTAHPGGPSAGWTYSWDFDDSSAQTSTPLPGRVHAFGDSGTYQVRVTVEDDAGNAGVSPLISVRIAAQTTSDSGGGASTTPGPSGGQSSAPGDSSSPAAAGTAPGSSSKPKAGASGKGAAPKRSRSVGPVTSETKNDAIGPIKAPPEKKGTVSGAGHGIRPSGSGSGSGSGTGTTGKAGGKGGTRGKPTGHQAGTVAARSPRIPLRSEQPEVAHTASEGVSRHGVKGVLFADSAALPRALIASAQPGVLAAGGMGTPLQAGRGGTSGSWPQWIIGIAAVAALFGWGVALEARPRTRRSRA